MEIFGDSQKELCAAYAKEILKIGASIRKAKTIEDCGEVIKYLSANVNRTVVIYCAVAFYYALQYRAIVGELEPKQINKIMEKIKWL